MPSKVKKPRPDKPPKCHVRSGDKVMVVTGASRGKTGTVIKVWPKEQRILLDGDAAVYQTKHVKADPQRQIEGGRQQKPKPIHISNVQLLDPETGKPTRVRRERIDGKLARVSKQSGHRFEV